MDVVTPLRLVTGAAALRRWAVAALVANIGIVVTGALVRLTGSGLGCPTWPRCSADSYVSHPALGLHGAIEFGNRLLTFVLFAVVVLTLVTALRRRHHGRTGVRWPAVVLVVGIPIQAVIGGISVLTDLNPYVVALHLLASMALIVIAVLLVRRTAGATPRTVDGRTRAMTVITFVAASLVVWLGTIVTGSGPHAGDEFAPRTQLDIPTVTHLHAAAVWVLLAATLLCLATLRTRAVVQLLVLEVLQALVGLAQYYSGLPVRLVMLHLLGAALTMAAAANLVFSVRRDSTETESETSLQLTASR